MSKKIVGYAIGDSISVELCITCAKEIIPDRMLRSLPERFRMLEGYGNEPETVEFRKKMKAHWGKDWDGTVPCLRCNDIIGKPGQKDESQEEFLRLNPSGIRESVTMDSVQKALSTKPFHVDLPEDWPFHNEEYNKIVRSEKSP